MISPVGRIKLGLQAALRRRYSYAALRVLRRAAARAIIDDIDRSVSSAKPYVGQAGAVASAYWRALLRLRKRFPAMDLSDYRGRP